VQRYVSEPLRLPPKNEPLFYRADLELVGLQKSGASFVLDVFVGNPEANDKTPHKITSGWAGTLPVFAHGDCWGGEGHCDIPRGPASGFDRRLPHALTPTNLAMEITAALRFLGPVEEVVVTIVAQEADPDREEREQILRFEKLMLVTYD
jgi:tyrosinase